MTLPIGKVAILGASRGLGLAISNRLSNASEKNTVFNFSRKLSSHDFSKQEHWEQIIKSIFGVSPDRIFYVAGGGPYGFFEEKKWQDHEWSFKVNFLFPAFLMHSLLNDKSTLKQIIFVGSDIAESKPDPMAASYCAGKHALRGLITSVQQELLSFNRTKGKNIDLRLFSPGYMNTSMLPKNARPRHSDQKIHEPDDVAQSLIDWAMNESCFNSNKTL